MRVHARMRAHTHNTRTKLHWQEEVIGVKKETHIAAAAERTPSPPPPSPPHSASHPQPTALPPPATPPPAFTPAAVINASLCCRQKKLRGASGELVTRQLIFPRKTQPSREDSLIMCCSAFLSFSHPPPPPPALPADRTERSRAENHHADTFHVPKLQGLPDLAQMFAEKKIIKSQHPLVPTALALRLGVTGNRADDGALGCRPAAHSVLPAGSQGRLLV